MTAGVVEGTLGGAGSYMTGRGPHTTTGFLRSTAMGAGTGAMPMPGGAADNAVGAASRQLKDVAPTSRQLLPRTSPTLPCRT